MIPSLDAEGPRRGSAGRFGRFLRWWQERPVLCLLLLSPGIPEYLSSSSSLTLLILNPALFLLLLGANLGMYGPGVLLVREAMVRWRRGWAPVLALGLAYGIAEEGVALSTLFDPSAGPVGVLGSYGHWLGVSWVWSAGVLMVHVVYSLSLPILLLGLALPETRGRPLLSARGIRVAFAVFALDVTVLALVVWKGFGFSMGPWLLTGSLLAIVLLAVAGRFTPVAWLRPPTERPRARPAAFLALGLALFPSTLLIESILGSLGVPAALTFLALLADYGAIFGTVRAWVGQQAHARELIGLAAGALAPIAVFGFVAALPLPVVGLADLLLALFLLRLWRRYGPRSDRSLPLAGLPASGSPPAAPPGAIS